MALLTNPMFNVGMGLLSSSRNPMNPYGGVQQGLLAAQRGRMAQQMDQYRQMQMQRMQQEEVARRIASAEQAAQKQRMEAEIAKLPPEQQAIARLDPSAWAKAAAGAAFAEPGSKGPNTTGLPEGFMWGPEGKQAMPIPGLPEPEPAQMTPYQREQIKLEREKLAAAQEGKAAKATEKQKQEAGREARKAEQTAIAIQAIDEAIPLVDEFMASGLGAGVAKMIGGTDANTLAGKLDTIKSTIGLGRLLEIKEQGGTLGALNQEEMRMLTASLGSLSQSMGDDELKAELRKVRALLAKANESGDDDLFNKADAIVGN